MRIAGFDTSQRVLVVAEIGNNHEGSVDVALRMIDAVAAAGAHAVKFQTFETRRFQSASDEVRYRRLSSFELTREDFRRLHDRARSHGLLFIATPLDLGSAAFLEDLVDAFKIASGDNTFYPLVSAVAASGKPVIVSSGLCDLVQIRRIQEFVLREWIARSITPQLAILHCVTSYPAPLEQTNLAAIPLMARELGCAIGYSDHTLGITACIAAAALGARIIEKHFTLDKAFSDFRDHQLSADPTDMRRLVEAVAEVPVLVGAAEKAVPPRSCAGRSRQVPRSKPAALSPCQTLCGFGPPEAFRPARNIRSLAVSRDVHWHMVSGFCRRMSSEPSAHHADRQRTRMPVA
jgi:N,N'-diacetyllegionaminate synthase